MRIDFSEPECSNCYHCRFLGVLNTQETEQDNATGSSVSSMPASSEPVNALGHDSTAVGSTSTSPVVHSSSAISFGTPPTATTSVISEPAQSVSPTISSHGAFGSPSQRPAFQFPVQATSASGASATSTSSTSSPVHSSSLFRLGSAPSVTTSVSSGPTQALGPATFQAGSIFQAPVQVNSGPGASASSTLSTSSRFHSSSPFGSAPAFTFSVPTQSLGPTTSGFRAFSAPTPPRFGTMQDPVQSSASSTSKSFSFGPAHNFGKPASASLFGNSVVFARPDIGYSPVPSSSTTTVVFGTTPVSVSSPFGPTHAPVQASVSSTSTFLPFGCVPASPASGSSLFTSGFGSLPGSSSFNLSGPDASTTASVFDTPTESVCAQFGSEQNFPSTTDSVCASSTEKTPLNSPFPGFGVGYFPGSSSNLITPSQLTTTPNFGGGLIGGGVKTSYPQPLGFSTATTLLPSSSFSSSAKFGSNSNTESHSFSSHEWSVPTGHGGSNSPGYSQSYSPYERSFSSYPPHEWSLLTGQGSSRYFGYPPRYSPHEWNLCTEQGGSRYPGYTTTHDGQTQEYISISASNPYLHKSHEELRWEDYKQGVKGGSFPVAPVTPMGSRPGANFSPSSTTVPPIKSNVQRPHETASVSYPAPGCTACGATTSSSASEYSTFNGATTPPSAATYRPGLFYPTFGSVPMMFGRALAAPATTPALQPYPVQGYILLLPFTALSLQ